MDWNWFFSSLAQATAAIAGIFAAFIITKIINLQSEFKRKEARMKKLLVDSDNYRDALKNRKWKWYCGAKTELALKKVDDLLEHGKMHSPEELLRKAKFPKFVPREDLLRQISDRIEQFNASKAASDLEVYTKLAEPGDEAKSAEDDTRDVLKNEKIEIDAAILKTRRHSRRAKLHLDEIDLDRDEFKLIKNSIIVAGLLFIFGIVLPLSFLRISNGTNEMLNFSDWLYSLLSIKGALLLVVTAIFLYILAIFWRVSQRMKFRDQDIAALRNDSILTTYSPYLAIRADNKNKVIVLSKS